MNTDIPDPLQDTGHFVEGGYRPPPPLRLPLISEVTLGSVFEDQEGILWKAITGQVHGKRWARALIVSSQKHRRVTRWTRVLLSIGWPLFFLTLGLLLQLVFSHPLLVISAVVLTALCLGIGGYLHRQTKVHLVRNDTPSTTTTS